MSGVRSLDVERVKTCSEESGAEGVAVDDLLGDNGRLNSSDCVDDLRKSDELSHFSAVPLLLKELSAGLSNSDSRCE